MAIAFQPVGTFSGASGGPNVLNNPTSLQFGPDGRLYVAEQNGDINAFTVSVSDGAYVATAHELLTLTSGGGVVKSIQNHDDDGTESNQSNRQVTGLAVTGTADNPVLYISSSDPRIASNGEVNLDTNSGVITRVTWTGSEWQAVDIVRGLPRSEENHSNNGLAISPTDPTKLYVMVGGNTNNGAPSSFFSYTGEYALSGTLLEINLADIENREILTDPDGGQGNQSRQYVYDLPTLDDPNVANVTGGGGEDAEGLDEAGPWGGNDGLNMAILPADAPLRIFADGFRNAYDIAFTPDGKLYTVDNGSNGNLGANPNTESGDDDDGDAISGEAINTPNNGGSGDPEPLFFIEDGGYYGHPNPARSNQNQSWTSYNNSGNPDASLSDNNVDSLAGQVPNGVAIATGFIIDPSKFTGDPGRLAQSGVRVERDSAQTNAIVTVGSSTNGIVAYDSNGQAFDGVLDGKLFVTQFNDNVTLLNLDDTGTGLAPVPTEGADGIFGTADDGVEDPDGIFFVANNSLGVPLGNPLDVTTGPDGTLWVAEIGSSEITVLAPADLIVPGDNDSDDDGILNVDDPFLRDASNGTSVTVAPGTPTIWEFSQDAGDVTPGPDGFGGGLTGHMIDGTTDFEAFLQSDSTRPGQNIQLDNVKFVTAAAGGTTVIEEVQNGDPFQTPNDGQFLFHTGFKLAPNVATFTVTWVVKNPGAVTGGSDITNNFQQIGGYLGDGTQSNYLKIVAIATNGNATAANVQIALENGDDVSPTIDLPANGIFDNAALVADSNIVFELEIDPIVGTAVPKATYSTTDGDVEVTGTETIDLTGSKVLEAIRGEVAVQGQPTGLAAGLFASNFGSLADTFQAVFDSITVSATEAPFPPDAVDDSARVGVDTPLEIPVANLLANDTDPNPTDTLTVTGVSNPVNGTVALANGVVTFTPAAGFQGTASFDYTISDGSATDTATVTVEVADEIVLYRVNAGGAEVAALASDPVQLAWAANTGTGAQSGTGFAVNTGNISTHSIANQGDPSARDESLPDYVPYQVFNQERWDPAAAPEMAWTFDVDAGATYEVRLFVRNGFGGTDQPGERVFDVEIEGTEVFSDVDLSATYGHQVAAMLSQVVTLAPGDATLDIEFLHDVENPLINAIEIVQLGSAPEPLPVVNILETAQTVGEGEQAFVSIATDFTVPQGETVDVNFTIEPLSGAAPGAGGDYEYASSSATFGGGTYTDTKSIAGSSSDLQIPVAVLQDSDIDPNEGFVLTINSVSANAVLGPNSSATVTIQDDDVTSGTVLFRVNAGGPEVAANDGGPAWTADQGTVANGSAQVGTASPYLVDRGIDDTTTATSDDVTYGDNTPTGPGTNSTAAPDPLFLTERFSEQANPNNIGYAFPVVDGAYTVNLYFDELFFGAANARVFDVAIEETLVLDDFDTFATYGNDTGLQSFSTTVTDGELNIEFLKTATNNPHIAAIEIIAADAAPYEPPADDLFGQSVEIADTGTAPSGPVALQPGDNVMSATQEGESGLNTVRDRDYFTVSVPPGFALTGIELDDYQVQSSNAPDAFFAFQEGDEVTVDPETGAGVEDLAGAIIYGSGDVGADLLATMRLGFDDPATGNALPAFDRDLTGDLTFWLNQGAGPSSATLNFVVEELPGTPGEVVAAINAGGPALSQDGIDFAADTGFLNGQTFADGTAGNGLQPVFDGTVYETERYGGAPGTDALAYEIPVLAGTYTVEIYFAEIFQSAEGARVFDVSVEGQLVLDDFDILAQTNGNIDEPIVFTVPGTVDPSAFGNTSAIDIDFNASADNAKVSAIVVRDADGGVGPTTLTLDIEPTSVSESGDGVTGTVTRTGSTAAALTVTLASSDSSAATVPATVEIPAGSTSATFAVSAVDDDLVDGPQTAVISASAPGVISPAEASLEVVDDDNELADPQPGTVLFRVNAGGAEAVAADSGPVWTADTQAANSPFLVNPGSNNDFPTNGEPNLSIDMSLLAGTGATPAVLGIERWDNTTDANGEMSWAFPVLAGTEVEVRLYLAELFTGLPDLNGNGVPTGDRIFDVSVDGAVPAAFDDLDPYTLAGEAFAKGVVVGHTVVSDGSIDLEFLHLSENPAIKGIEIFVAGTPDGEGPAATLGALEPPAAGAGTFEFTVTFADPAGIDVPTLGNTDVTVSNAALGYDAAAALIAVDQTANGSPRSATYQVPAPGGNWDFADNGTFAITLADGEVADLLGNTAAGGELGTFEVAFSAAAASALIEVTPGGGLAASTFGGSSFQVTNTSDAGVQITSVRFDLSTGILPDMVFDPTGSGGDATASPLTPSSGATATGFVAPSDPAVDPFSQPRNGGFDVLSLDFTDFEASEQFFFTTDVDPNSIQDVPGAGDAGAVSGYELIGSTVAVTFSNGETVRGSLFEDGSLGGAQVVLEGGTTTAPTIEILEAGADEVASLPGTQVTVTGPDHTVRVSGTPGEEVALLQMDARLFIASGDAPFNVSADELPFYANEAMAGKTVYTGEIGPGGFVDIPVALLTTDGGATPDGGLNHFVAVTSSTPYAVDQATSETSNTLVVRQGSALVFDESGTVQFDGTNATVIELPHDPTREIAAGTIAFSFAPADTSGFQGLYSKDASGFSGGGNHFVVYLQGSTLIARFQDGTSSAEFDVPGIEAGTEYEIAATFGPGGVGLWVDGNLVESAPLIMDWSDGGNTEFEQWGGRGWASSSGEAGFDAPFEGTISDRQIFASVLTASEIAALAGTSSGANTPPDAAEDAAAGDEDTVISGSVLTNDSDAEGSVLTAALVSGVANGSLTLNPDGTFDYTPNADFNGEDSFTYVANDGLSDSAPATVTITVNPVNDDPVAVDDAAQTLLQTPVVIDVLANDLDVDGDTLAVVAVTDGANGAVVDNADGTVTYTAAGGSIGDDSFTYTVDDQAGGASSTATVTVTVLDAPNSAPVANEDTVFGDEDTVISGAVLANDTDDNLGDTLTAVLVAGVSNGTLTLNADGTFDYTPNADFNGEDSFTYVANDGLADSAPATATIAVAPVNDAPVANDDSAAGGQGQPIVIDLLANDEDVDGDALTIGALATTSDGTVVDNGDGTVTFTSGPDFEGAATFTYTAFDGTVASEAATVSVAVSAFPVPIFDEPAAVTFDGTANDVIELPHDDIYEISAGSVAFTFTAADTSGAQGLFVKDASSLAGGGNHFALYLEGSTLSARFQDGNSASLTVPGIVAGVDYDVAITFDNSGGKVYLDGSEVASTTTVTMDWSDGPNQEFIQWGGRGWASATGAPGFDAPFDGTISNRKIYDVALTTAQIVELQGGGSPSNGDPVAGDDAVSTAEDESVNFDPTANDIDPDGDTPQVTLVEPGQEPANGAATIEADGTVTYTPNADFNGIDTFTLVIEDGNGGIDTSVVDVTVTPEPDLPVAADDTATVQVGGSVVIDVLANDTDADGDTLTVTAAGAGASSGTVSNKGDGTVTYTSTGTTAASETFSYDVTDGTSTVSASVTVTVTEAAVPVFSQPGAKTYSGSSADVDNYDPADLSALEITEGTIVFSFVDADPSVRQGLVVKDASGAAGGGNHFAALIDGGDLDVRFQNADGQTILSADIDADVEYEVAATFDEEGVALYVDGVLEDSDPLVMDWTSNVEWLQVGGLGWGSSSGSGSFTNPFSGQIADVAIYDEVLSAQAIADLAGESSIGATLI